MSTTDEQLDAVKAGMEAFVGDHQERFTQFLMVLNTVTNASNTLEVLVLCAHATNWQDMNRRYLSKDLFMRELRRLLSAQGISYTLPPQPLIVNGSHGSRPDGMAAFPAPQTTELI